MNETDARVVKRLQEPSARYGLGTVDDLIAVAPGQARGALVRCPQNGAATSGSNATIVKHRAIDDWKGIDRPLLVKSQFNEIADASKGTLLEPSLPRRCTYICAGESMARHLITKGTAMTRAELFFIGYIVFEDDNAVRRRVDFRREYDLATRSFSVNRDA